MSEPVTQEELALALERVRRYVASMSAMILATGAGHSDGDRFREVFKREDDAFLEFVAAMRTAD